MFSASNFCVRQRRSAQIIGKRIGASRARILRTKIGTVQKEASETQYWLELLIELEIAKDRAVMLHMEATELLAIFTSIGNSLSIL